MEDSIGQHVLKIKNMMDITDDELYEIRLFLFDHGKDDEELLHAILNSKMNERQKMFLCYVRGIGQILNIKTDKKFVDQTDAFKNISFGFNGWNMADIIITLSSVLKAMMIDTLDKVDIPSISMQISDDFCRFSEDYKRFKELSDRIKGRGEEYEE